MNRRQLALMVIVPSAPSTHKRFYCHAQKANLILAGFPKYQRQPRRGHRPCNLVQYGFSLIPGSLSLTLTYVMASILILRGVISLNRGSTGDPIPFPNNHDPYCGEKGIANLGGIPAFL